MAEVRLAVLVAVVCGQLAAATAGALPWAVAAPAAALTAAAAAGSAIAPAARHAALRGLSTGLTLLVLPALLAVDGDSTARLLVLLAGLSVASAVRWLTPRDLRTGLLCGVVLLLASAAFARDLLVAPPLVAGWVAVLVAGLRLPALRALEGAVRPEPSPPGAPRGAGVLPVVALAVALGVVAFLLLPPPGAPRLPLPDAGRSGEAERSTGGGTQNAFSSPVMDLTRRVGEISTARVLEVDSSSPALWRSTVYDRYDGASWSVGERPLTGLRGPPPYLLEGGDRGLGTRTDVAVTSRHDGTVWAPGEVVALGPSRLPAAAVDGEGAVRLAAPVPSYEVVTRPPVVDPSVLRAADGGDDVDPRWLQLPPDLPPRVRALAAELTAGATTRADAAAAVERWLQSNATYRLDPPVPAAGEDAVDRFLFVDRIGYCQQFAASAAVLLRAAGVPARVVTGLGYGVDRGSRRTYQVQHLHAWTEVHYPGVGWSPLDATPAADLAAEEQSDRDRLATWLSEQLRRLQDAVGGRLGLAALVALTVAAVAAVVTVVLRRRRRRAAAQRPAGAPPGPVRPARAGPALAAFLRLDARLGPAGRRPQESLGELRTRLRPPPDVDDALSTVEAECYAPVPPVGATDAAGVLDAADADELAAAGRGRDGG